MDTAFLSHLLCVDAIFYLQEHLLDFINDELRDILGLGEDEQPALSLSDIDNHQNTAIVKVRRCLSFKYSCCEVFCCLLLIVRFIMLAVQISRRSCCRLLNSVSIW